MRGFRIFLLTLLAASAAAAVPLKIVNVSAPAINCKFDVDCKITVDDTAPHFTLPGASGEGFLQSRLWPVGEAGTAGAGRFAYLYRIDLTQVVGLTAAPCVSKLDVTFGPVVSLDYDGDKKLDQVFVITQGGLGSVAPSSATRIGNLITFHFATPVCAGSSPGKGQTSYFFGLASTKPPKAINAKVTPTLGPALSLDARAPSIP